MARSPFTLPALRETHARGLALPSGRIVAFSFICIMLGLVGGGLLSLRWQQRNDLIQQPITRDGGKQFVQTAIVKLEAEQADLKRQLTDARARLNTLQETSSQEKAQLTDITGAIGAEKVTAGLVALEGPGIVATFDDSNAPAIPPNEDPANYILHDYNLRDVLNTLWAAGAEAISINGERIVSRTSLYCVGTTVICNVTRLSPPYEVHAIGNADALEAGLHTSPQMQQFNARAQIYDLPITIRKDAKVQVPAYSGITTYKYATVSDNAAAPTPAAAPAGH